MNVADLLRPHVPDIKADAAAGNVKAQFIIDMYEMHRACPRDPGAHGLCIAAFEDWQRERAGGR